MKTIQFAGAKNAALPLFAATLLAKNLYYFKNVPKINDILTQIFILQQFNVRVNWINHSSCFIDTTDMRVPSVIDYSQNTRGTYYFIGASSYLDSDMRFKVATGCEIDIRQIDFHIALLQMSGKTATMEGNTLIVSGVSANTDSTYTFPKPSIGATINALLMFVRSKSVTTLHNYARDPYITDVIALLRSMGAHIDVTDTTLVVHGSPVLHEGTLIRHSIIPDPIEALTYIIFSGIVLPSHARSPYIMGPVRRADYGDALGLLEAVGIFLEDGPIQGYCHVRKTELQSFTVETGYFPQIYTDIQPFLCLIGLFAKGRSTITEIVWSDRFQYTLELVKMGYRIDIVPPTIHIHGLVRDAAEPAAIRCTDLRGGMAILLMMRYLRLAIPLEKRKYVDRGYANYEPIIATILESSTEYYTNYPTKHLSNIEIGGYAAMFAEVTTKEDLFCVIQDCQAKGVPYKVIGGGNNVYFAEQCGMIVKNSWSELRVVGSTLVASSGASLMDLVLFAAYRGYDLSGLAGIPGTVGGAVYGNAGAYGLEMRDIILSCEVFDGSTVRILGGNDMQFAYRSSYMKDEGCKDILVTATFVVPASDTPTILSNICKTVRLRNSRLPSERTLGSVFRNIRGPSGTTYAWQLIDGLGLRGQIIHGIKIHDTHPNIFLNVGMATSADLTTLIAEITAQVPLTLEIERIT